jgi:hypothetical protein
MNKEFIPYEQALALKELGFDEPCFSYYLEDGTWVPASYSKESTVYPSNSDLLSEWCSAPLYQQAFRWFKEKYEIYSWVKVEYEYGGITPTYYITGKRQDDIAGGSFNTYEEAELECLKKLIQIIKEKL